MYIHLCALQHISGESSTAARYPLARALLLVAVLSWLDAVVNWLLIVGNKKLPQAGVPVLLDTNAKKHNQFRYGAEDRVNLPRRRAKHRLRPAGAQNSREAPGVPS